MKIARTPAELDIALSGFRERKARVGFVPTMGALHDGHLSLVEFSKRSCDVTAVSIFVNPAQFAAGEDLSRYPRPLEADLELLRGTEADVVFLPDTETIYPPGCSTFVDPPRVSLALEGEHRPAHFRGVATVVLKLFHLTRADVAFFGQKDYQQCLVVRHMVRDLNVPIDIVVCPIVRNDDGLALSSRNIYLSADDRRIALSLCRTLNQAASLIRGGEQDARAIAAEMTQSLIDGGVTSVDYAVVCDADTLEMLDVVRLPAVLLLAARVGTTRLIDNLLIS